MTNTKQIQKENSMCNNKNSEKSVFFAKTPVSINSNKESQKVLKPHISQIDRELLMAGYKIYHISAHRATTVLVIDNEECKIIESSGDFIPKRIPNDLQDLIQLVKESEMSDAYVTQIQI